jgi:hypothetical protein
VARRGYKHVAAPTTGQTLVRLARHRQQAEPVDSFWRDLFLIAGTALLVVAVVYGLGALSHLISGVGK